MNYELLCIAQYALTIFGRSMRETNCDCDRTEDVSLLQTVYLQNDQQLLDQLTDRNDSWLAQLQREYKIGTSTNARKSPRRPGNYDKVVKERKAKIKQLRAVGKDETAVKLERQLSAYKKRFEEKSEPVEETSEDRQLAAAEVVNQIVQEAYLRTLSRYPTDQELERSVKYLGDSADITKGAKDLLWFLRLWLFGQCGLSHGVFHVEIALDERRECHVRPIHIGPGPDDRNGLFAIGHGGGCGSSK